MVAVQPQVGANGAKRVSILGATGSVGASTADLIRSDREAYDIVALTAHENVEGLIELVREFRPQIAVIGREELLSELKDGIAGLGTEAAAGAGAVEDAAGESADWVMAAIVGAAGLKPTMRAVEQGAIVALANKESLVCAGHIVVDLVERAGATLLPVDSEHNAIFQVFEFDQASEVARIILTASGGPFRTWPRDEMASVTPEQAVAHPNWSMGAKISVDSATMMNKGLELIEAYHLFPVERNQIEILVHPQSVVHSMVEYVDGSVLAQLGSPDMRTPIGYALGWPKRITTPSARLNLAEIGSLTFEAPSLERFPALRLAREALEAGGAATTVLNAANEAAVGAFLNRCIGFLDIVAIVDQALQNLAARPADTLDAIWELDRAARDFVDGKIAAQ